MNGRLTGRSRSGRGDQLQLRHRVAERSANVSFGDQEPKTLAEAVYRQLRQDILSGKLSPGRKLRFVELRLGYDAGMSTLRESLSHLTADRLVIAEGQRGFRVAPISLAELWDITELRTQIESAALEAAIDAGDDAWEAEIIAAQHRLSKLKHRGDKTPALLNEEGAALHKAFHMALISACPSIWRLRVVDVLYDHSERYRRLQTSYLPDLRNSAHEHHELMQAVIGRHKAKATRLLTQHLKRTAQALSTVAELWSPAEPPTRR